MHWPLLSCLPFLDVRRSIMDSCKELFPDEGLVYRRLASSKHRIGLSRSRECLAGREPLEFGAWVMGCHTHTNFNIPCRRLAQYLPVAKDWSLACPCERLCAQVCLGVASKGAERTAKAQPQIAKFSFAPSKLCERVTAVVSE
jgi:hypothetical protein